VSGERTLFYVQVGAFNRREIALSFADTFNQRGYPAIVLDPFPSDRREIFRVRIGGYATREEAAEVRTKLQTETSRTTDYFIIRS
jgi:cell division septation protein DedD